MSSLKHPLVYNRETKQIVAPMGKHFKGAVQYDPVRDKGKLVCIHCFQADMTHRDEKRSIGAGNVFGWQSHFTTIGTREPKKPKRDSEGNVIPYVKNAHKGDCVEAVLGSGDDDDPDKVVYTKGYKIYIDMGQMARVFKRNAAPITRDPETRRIVVQDPDLIDRERVTIKTPEDFIRALKYLETSRLNDAVVVHGGNKYGFKEWFIRTGADTSRHPDIRWVNLGKRLLNGNAAPVMAHIDLAANKSGTVIPDAEEGDRLRYHLKTIVVDHVAEHRKVTIKFWLNIRNEHLFDPIRNAELQQFIAQSKPDMYQDRKDRGLYHVDLTVRNPKWITEADLVDITLQARKNAQKRAEITASPSIAA